MEKLQCSICGGNLVMSDDGESAICDSCGIKYKKETVKKMIMEISGPVQVEGIHNSNSLAERAETFLQLGEIQKATDAFRKLADEYPGDYRGWWGLTRLLSWEEYFYKCGTEKAEMPLVCKRAFDFAEGDVKGEIQAFFEEKVAMIKGKTDQRHQSEQAAKEEYDRKKSIYDQALQDAKNALAQADKEYSRLSEIGKKLKQEQSKLLERPKRDWIPINLGLLIAIVVGCSFSYVIFSNNGVETLPQFLATVSFALIPCSLQILLIWETKSLFTKKANFERDILENDKELTVADTLVKKIRAEVEELHQNKTNDINVKTGISGI